MREYQLRGRAGREYREEPAVWHNMNTQVRRFQVMKWHPTENRFNAVTMPVSDLGQVLRWSAEQRLNDGRARFAIFDEDGNMVETEAGRLLALFPPP